MEIFTYNNKYGDGISWRRGEILGKGSFGTVFSATSISKYSCFPRIMAIKSAEVSNSASIQIEKQILDELNKCPHIIACLGEETTFGDNGTSIYNMLLEYGSGGTLSDRIRKFGGGGGLCEFEVKYYTKSLLSGIKYIHENGYVHRDLKPENILLVRNYEEDEKEASITNKFSVRISDFGFAKKDLKRGTKFDTKRKAEGHYWKGTPMYLSPEAVKNYMQECPSDIWALGCIVLEMLTGQAPWNFSQQDLLEKIGYSRQLPKIPRKLSEDAKDFLRKCFVRNHNNRWTAAMLLSHPFLEGIKELDMEEIDAEETDDTFLKEEQFLSHQVEGHTRKKCKCNNSTVVNLKFPPIQNYSHFIY